MYIILVKIYIRVQSHVLAAQKGNLHRPISKQKIDLSILTELETIQKDYVT